MGTIYDLTQVDFYQEFENWRIFLFQLELLNEHRIGNRWPKGKAMRE